MSSREPLTSRVLLAAYWIALAISTHYPRVSIPKAPQSDKLIHAAAFGGLAFLWWRALRIRDARSAPLAAIVLCSYAAIDEYAQRFVGRDSDMVDWLADMLGIAVVLTIAEVCRRCRSRSESV